MSDLSQETATTAEGLIAKALRSDEWMERHFGIAAHSSDVAETAVKALADAGWRMIPPRGTPGYCESCRCLIEPNTVHSPFNGNQMFACEITRVGPPDA